MTRINQLKRFRDAFAGTEADGAIISSPLNIRWLCGFDFSDGYLAIFHDTAYLITDSRYVEAAKLAVSDFEVTLPDEDMLKYIGKLANRHGATSLAIEEAEVSLAQYKTMSEKIKDVALCSGASKILRELREVKQPFEIELIAKAQRITDAAFDHILGFISPDVTETDVALELEFFMRRHGAEATAFDTIAVSGVSSSIPHGVPHNKKLSRGFFTMDFGAKYKGYCSDMTRTVSIGKADEDMKKIYNTVLSAQKAALEYISEGVNCRTVDGIARKIISDAGFGECFGHSLGHGVGMFIHESPSISPRSSDTSVLRRGNVVTVEPGIYVKGKYGCRIEDMVVIDHNGKTLNFTQSPKMLVEI